MALSTFDRCVLPFQRKLAQLVLIKSEERRLKGSIVVVGGTIAAGHTRGELSVMHVFVTVGA